MAMRNFSAFFLCLAVLVATARPAAAVGEQVGRIRGRVFDAGSGAPLRSATVIVRSPAMIGGARVVLTDDKGRFEITNLPPGRYAVEVSYEGTLPITRTALVVTGQATPMEIGWSLEQSGVETVAVSERRPLTKPDSTQTGTVLDADVLRELPTGRSYQSVAQLVPGVSGGANPNIKGGLNLNNRYLIDGLDVTDPVTQTFATNLSFDSTQGVDVMTGGMEAQYNSLAGIINTLSLRGTGEFHANASFYVNHSRLSSSGNYGSALYDGSQPFNDDPSGVTQAYQANINVGGPLVRDRLWYNVSYELRLNDSSTVKSAPLGVPPYNIQHPPLTSTNHYARLHLTYAATPSHRLAVSAGIAPGFFNNTTGGNSSLGVAETRQNQGGIWAIANWEWLVSPRLTPSLQLGFITNTIEAGPQGQLGSIDTTGCEQFTIMDNCTYDRNQPRPRHINTIDNTNWYQGGTYQLDKRYKLQVDPTIEVRGHLAGTHTAKAGLQLQYNYRTRELNVPGGSLYRDRGDPSTTLESGLCDPTAANPIGCYRRIDTTPISVHQAGLGAGLYLQDRWWTPLSWLTILPGIRFDYGRTTDRLGREVTSLFGIGPRLGVTIDPWGDARNVFSAYYGRHTETLSLLAASNVDATEAAVTVTRAWDPVGKNFDTILGMTGGEGGLVIDHDAKTPHKDELTLSARHAITNDSVVGVDYTWNRISNLWSAVEINRIWDPTGQRVVGWADPTKPDLDVFLFTAPDANHRTYQGVILYGEGRPIREAYLNASYTLSWTYGPALTVFGQNTAFSQFDNPRQSRFYDGFDTGEFRHYLRLIGSYTLFGHLTIGGNFTYTSGVAVTKAFFNNWDGTYSNFRSPIGTEPGSGNDTKSISEFRTPDQANLDLRLVYNLLPVRTGQQLNIIVDIFNALGTRLPNAITSTDIPTFGQVATRQNPLRLQLAINWLY
jgi:hypothetical protein